MLIWTLDRNQLFTHHVLALGNKLHFGATTQQQQQFDPCLTKILSRPPISPIFLNPLGWCVPWSNIRMLLICSSGPYVSEKHDSFGHTGVMFFFFFNGQHQIPFDAAPTLEPSQG